MPFPAGERKIDARGPPTWTASHLRRRINRITSMPGRQTVGGSYVFGGRDAVGCVRTCTHDAVEDDQAGPKMSISG
jgi:hypothetical protein